MNSPVMSSIGLRVPLAAKWLQNGVNQGAVDGVSAFGLREAQQII